MRHLLSLLDLVLRQLHLVGRRIIIIIVTLAVIVVVILALTPSLHLPAALSLLRISCVLRRLRLTLTLFGCVCAVLLRDFVLHHVDGVLLKFLTDLFLFALPLVLKALRTFSLVISRILVTFAAGARRHKLKVKEGVVEYFKVKHLFTDWLLKLNLNLLVRPAPLLRYERVYGLEKTDFVVQRRWPYDGRRLPRRRIFHRDCYSSVLNGPIFASLF